MMNSILKLNILTPDLHFFSGSVVSLKTMDLQGPLEILPNHMALVTLIREEVNEFTDENGKTYRALISDGIMRIRDNNVTILCPFARWHENNMEG